MLPGPNAPVGDISLLSEGTVTDMLLGAATSGEHSPEPELMVSLPLAEITASMLDTSGDSEAEQGRLLIVEEDESEVSREL